jgi:hypothetical protein
MGSPVVGDDDGAGYGVRGDSLAPHQGRGVEGIATGGDGVIGQTRAPHSAGVRGVHTGHFSAIAVIGELSQGITGVKGQQGGGSGVGGDDPSGSGVWGDSTEGAGVVGTSSAAAGVIGDGATSGVAGSSADGTGVTGVSENAEGIHGESSAGDGRFVAAIKGLASNPRGLGPGVFGESKGSGSGVLGKASHDAGVIGFHSDPYLGETTVGNDASRAGVFGASKDGAGVLGYTQAEGAPAVYAFGGLKALGFGTAPAGLFEGDVRVEGNIDVRGDIFLPGADCAENFDIAEADEIEPGTVVVIDPEGRLRASRTPYDRRVAGVISGAGEYKPAIILDAATSRRNRQPVALLGKTYCKVDARYAPIMPGDLLTSSATQGHAMSATNPVKAFGAIIGKALSPSKPDTGLIPILVTLR